MPTQAEWQRHLAQLDAADPHHAALPPLDRPDPPTDAIGRTLRHDGWTPERQATFLALVAEGQSAERACRLVGMSPSSAYALRTRAAGQAFALGWRAANLHARERIANGLLTRAVEGYTETVTRPDGSTIERHRFDNRLAVSMLARLDRQAEAPDSAAANAAARAVAGDFDSFLALVGDGDAATLQARAGRFLALRGQATHASDPAVVPVVAAIVDAVDGLARADRFVRTGAALPVEVATADLDPADRSGWTAEQWQRADAAGLIAVTPAANGEDAPLSPLVDDVEPLDDLPVWWNSGAQEWQTDFPPPADFRGVEHGEWGEEDYYRELTVDELAAVATEEGAREQRRARRAAAHRDAWFAECREDGAALCRALDEEGQPSAEDVPAAPPLPLVMNMLHDPRAEGDS